MPTDAPVGIGSGLKAMGGELAVALTVRELAPFDRRLGVSQTEYEQAIARLCDRVVDAGFHICAVSMCTGLDTYTHDDRMVALRIKNLVKRPDRLFVVMDELSDLELGQFFSECRITVATRLHSAIVSMRFGTPAVAIAYEHKTVGTMNSLDLAECVIDMRGFCSGNGDDKILKLIQNAPQSRVLLNDRAQREAEVARRALSEACRSLIE
jgi:colanic acid/amylovoran biosynthesis protein